MLLFSIDIMRHYYRSHGSHCYLRSFKTKCPKCGADVLYWECKHGSKVFFQYPPYGKLIKHYCRHSSKQFEQKNKYKVIVKKPKYLLDDIILNCPICGKPFKDEKNLKDHIKQLKKSDKAHKQFFDNELKIKDQFYFKQENKKNEKKSKYKPKFGKINIKKTENNTK